MGACGGSIPAEWNKLHGDQADADSCRCVVFADVGEQEQHQQRTPLRRHVDTPGAEILPFIGIAVFVPVAFISGISGELFRQFAVTVAVSMFLSAINALTLSPALCAILLKPHAHGEHGHSHQEALPRLGIVVLVGLAAFYFLTPTVASLLHIAVPGHGEASHGDVGMITAQDVVLAISNSGETDELITILPVIKRLNVPLISMTGRVESTLARASNVVLDVSCTVVGNR